MRRDNVGRRAGSSRRATHEAEPSAGPVSRVRLAPKQPVIPRSSLSFALACLALAAINPCHAQQPPTIVVREDFSEGLDEWRRQRLDGRSTEYRIVDVDGDAALKAASDDAAAALIRTIGIGPVVTARVRWRWRIAESLTENLREKEKEGDDYAARLMILFGDDSISADTRALAYVWAGNERSGSSFLNPYSTAVATFVLQSGDRNARTWMLEDRDVVADYLRAFGEQPPELAGIAVLVDTDNTGARAMAWFDEIEVIAAPTPGHP